MKILHTSDWHLGHQHFNYDRTDDHLHFFDQLCSIVAAENPDAMLVSGDIFDVAVPSVAAQRLYTEQLLRIHRACPSMHIVITAGNHDSRLRLEVNRELWQPQNVHIVGTLDTNSDDMFAKITVPISRNGRAVGAVVAMPFVAAANLPGNSPSYSDRYTALFADALSYAHNAYGTDMPVVAMAHLGIGHAPSIGNTDTYPLSIFAEGYAYVALGHIHNSHSLTHERILYSGSPIPMNFSESYQHSVVIAEVSATDAPTVRRIPLTQHTEVIDLSPEPLPYEQILPTLNNLDTTQRAYLRILMSADGMEHPDLHEAIIKQLDNTNVKFCCIEVRNNAQSASANNAEQAITLSEFKEMTPLEIAIEHFRATNNIEMPEELIECFNQIVNQVKNASHEDIEH